MKSLWVFGLLTWSKIPIGLFQILFLNASGALLGKFLVLWGFFLSHWKSKLMKTKKWCAWGLSLYNQTKEKRRCTWEEKQLSGTHAWIRNKDTHIRFKTIYAQNNKALKWFELRDLHQGSCWSSVFIPRVPIKSFRIGKCVAVSQSKDVASGSEKLSWLSKKQFKFSKKMKSQSLSPRRLSRS